VANGLIVEKMACMSGIKIGVGYEFKFMFRKKVVIGLGAIVSFFIGF
jgi:hypothetical protein